MLGSMHWLDWAVLFAYIAGTSWFADRLADRKQTIRDFFLGGRKLPWWAVSGSIVASEVSGVTFVAIPAIAFAQGGNYTYMMLAFGSILARFLIGYFLIPAFYRHEVYSPYELMGLKLGPRVTRAASGLFMVGAILGQGARLFLAAIVLDAITGMGTLLAIILLSIIGIVWTWIGGITSVVWTDVVQFVMIVLAATAAIVAVVATVPGGVQGIVEAGRAAGKFQLWNFSVDPRSEFTFWCGIFGFTFLTLGSHGTDQMTAQRFFCCHGPKEARRAVLWSSVAMLIPLMMLTVGVGLYAYYRAVPPTAAEAAKLATRPDYIFPLFILRAMPMGIKGLFFASIFSAATQTAAIAAMAQTALGFYRGARRHAPESDAHLVKMSRLFIVLSGVAICLMALVCSQIRQYPDLFRLAMNMASYTYGAMLGILLLSLLPGRRDARGLVWGVPFTLLLVFALQWQQHGWARWTVAAATVALVVGTLPLLRRELAKVPWVFLGAAVVLYATYAKVSVGGTMQPIKLAFPWTFPLGTALTLALGLALASRRPAPVTEEERAAEPRMREVPA